MQLKFFLDNFLQLSSAEIIIFVQENRKQLKLLFINVKHDDESVADLRKIHNYLAMLNASALERDTPEMQFLYTELGLYFKRSNIQGAVRNCISKIGTSVLKFRLLAWMHYMLYNSASSHISSLPVYLRKLSCALTDGEEQYENDVIRDLHIYYEFALQAIEEYGSPSQIQAFIELFESKQLADEFPILYYYRENREQFNLHSQVTEPVYKVFEPSDFAERLFRVKFLNYIKAHPKTIWHQTLLGFSFDVIKSQIIGFGQTDYDKEVEGLSGLDIVKLYAYCNMRMHFFAAISLFERSDIFRTMYNSPGSIKFIDIGCGPATSALALIDHIYEHTREIVLFDYIGIDYYKNMREGAEYFMKNDAYLPKGQSVYLKSLNELDFTMLDKANSIFINASYLFASVNLDVVELAENVLNVRKSKPECPCYFLFQNTTDRVKNVKYFDFKKRIGEYITIYTGEPNVPYSNQRNSLRAVPQRVFQEILKLQ